MLLPWLVVCALSSGCDSPDNARIEEARTKLVGTWLREVDEGSVKARRVLVLAADGKFTDHVLTATAGEAPEHRELAGEWSFDGTNLKRKYLRENGRQFSGGALRYATFPLLSVTQSELVVKDTIQGRDAGFRRVPEGTTP